MVGSQYRLITEKFGIIRLVSVVGPSMAGMQSLQWAVTHPDTMDSIVPLIPFAHTTAWTTGIFEMVRRTIMANPKFKGGDYARSDPPDQGMRLWAGWLFGVLVRTPTY